MQNKSIPIFVSADPALGAFNVSPGNDRFTVQFKNQLEIHPDARQITLEVVSAEIWWTVLNVKLGINDQFKLLVDGDGSSPYTITIEPGLYDVTNLNSAVNRELINAGLASGLVTITGDSASQKIVLTLGIVGLQVEWAAQTFFLLTGFNSAQLVPSIGFTTGSFSELAPNIANFSDVSSFLLHTDLVQTGILIGDREAQVIANPQITVPPGSLINFSPDNPIKIAVPQLRGTRINQATFYITDQLNRALDFNGEFFSLLLEIKYQDPDSIN